MALLLLLAACDPDDYPDEVTIYAMTGPPPSSTAEIVTDSSDGRFAITMSLGVAIAVVCYDNCGETSSCAIAKLTPADPATLGVRPLYRVGTSSEHELVLVASETGTTSLRVESECAKRDYSVEIR